jgi:hypothetical protein
VEPETTKKNGAHPKSLMSRVLFMKHMDNLENNAQQEKSFFPNDEIKAYLLETSKWGKFMAIVGYVGMGILILIALFMMFGLSKLSGLPGPGFPMGMFGLIYIVLAAMYYFPVTYLYQFSLKIKQGLNSDDFPTIVAGFSNLKSLFKFIGIFTIVVLSIYGVLLLIVLPTTIYFFK